MNRRPLDHRFAAALVRPLVGTSVTPNQLTAVSGLLSLAGAGLFAWAEGASVHWGAGIFILSRFIGHMDGELARQAGKVSRSGYIIDGVIGAAAYSVLFLGIAIGLWRGGEGAWTIMLAIVTTLAIVIIAALQFRLEADNDDPPPIHPGWGPVRLEDGVYLIGPIVWLGFVYPLFIAGCVGTLLFLSFRTAHLVFRA